MARVILHVDDDLQLPAGVAEALEAEGYEWIRTADPETAMRVVEEREPALVLMELALAGCDGPDLLAGIRSVRGGAVPVLVLTHLPRDSGEHGEAIALGVADFLSKPVRGPELLASIRELAPPPAAAPAAAPAVQAASCELSGQLCRTPVPELLARLRRRGDSGVLDLQRGELRVTVQLRNGSPIGVSSNGARSEGGAAAAVATSDDEAEAMLFETFRWSDGRYRLLAGRRLQPDTTLELSREPAGMLMRGVLGASPLELVRERLRKRENLYVCLLDSGAESLGHVEFTPQQAEILKGLDGQDSLGHLCASHAFEERVLYGLWVTGVIELNAMPTLELNELYEQAPVAPGAPQPDAAPETPSPPVRATSIGSAVSEALQTELSQTLRQLAQQLLPADDFDVLAVPVQVSDDGLREAYQRVRGLLPDEALQSPDPDLRARAERVRDRIEAAYAHLKDPETRRAYTLLREEEEQDRDARTGAERALEGERWFRKGRVHLERRRYGDAVEAFGMATHLDPNEGEYSAHLGYALFLSKPGDDVVRREAMEHVANGIKRSPTSELSYVYLGRILKARGEIAAALKLFQRALRIKPDCHPALQEVRLLEMRQDRGKGVLSRLLRR